MLRHKAYRYRLYPTAEQAVQIAKTIGCARYVYNHFLSAWNQAYQDTGKGLSYTVCSGQLTTLKRQAEVSWLQEADKFALQNALRHLADAFHRFFKGQNQPPRYKSKRSSIQSYVTQFTNGNIELFERHIKLPKLGRVRCRNSRMPNGRIINATVERTASGKYFVSVLCEEEVQPLPKTNGAVGIDLGITDFAILSDGQKIHNGRFTQQMSKRLKREQRKLSRRARAAKERGVSLRDAKNYQKQKCKVARLHEKVANQRTDFLNKLSTELIRHHDILCIEDLQASNLLRNKRLARSIADVSWSEFVAKLRYKAEWYGRTIVQVSRWFPSSQLCSDCGHTDGKKPLSVRQWTCPVCHATHDRDINASRNILAEGLRIHATI